MKNVGGIYFIAAFSAFVSLSAKSLLRNAISAVLLDFGSFALTAGVLILAANTSKITLFFHTNNFIRTQGLFLLKI